MFNCAKFTLISFIKDNFFHFLVVLVYLLFSLYIAGSDILIVVIYNSYAVILENFAYLLFIFFLLSFIWTIISNINKGYKCLNIFYDSNLAYFSTESILNIIFTLLILPIFLSSYAIFKTHINQSNGFVYDEIFYSLDKYLHFGNSPWELLHPFLSSPIITKLIDILYGFGWVSSWFFIFIMICISSDKVLKWTFFSTYFLSWILFGTFTNNYLASAGPCYYNNIYIFHNPYKELLLYLSNVDQQLPLNALLAQNSLWTAYLESMYNFGAGISAMPSMHLSLMTTATLGAFRLNINYGIVYVILTIGILIGSVHLGWHYAIDGYISIIATAALWFILSMISGFKYKRHLKASTF